VKRSKPEPVLVLEQYAMATREVAEAVAGEDWIRALEALDRRQGLLPAFQEAFRETASPASVVSRLEKLLEVDSQCRARLVEARARLTGKLQEMDRMALWAKAAQGSKMGEARTCTDLKG
jgi:hypothetical protein